MISKSIRTLIVDDEIGSRKDLVNALNETPEFEVIDESGNIEDAFQKIVQLKPDAVFLDVRLVSGDAFDLLMKMRESKIPSPPIILNTGFEDFEISQRAFNEFQKEIIKILKKPFYEDWETTADGIVDLIYTFYNQRQLENQNKKKDFETINSGSASWRVKAKNILYIQTGKKGSGSIVIHTAKRGFAIYKTLT